jgi:hypothetical protein
MVYFNGPHSFGGVQSPIDAQRIGPNLWFIFLSVYDYSLICALVWEDCGPLDPNENWIPEGEDRQEFIQLVLSNLPNAGYGSGGGIPSAAESSAVDYQDDESDDESNDCFSEEDDDESDDESNDCFSEEDDDESDDDESDDCFSVD